MEAETALGAKLARAGYVAREVRFQMAVAEFLNNGGTVDRAHELIAVAADKMEGEGRVPNADKAGKALPPLRTNESKGQPSIAAKANDPVPALSAERNGAGQSAGAAKADVFVPRPVSHAKRGVAAIASVQKVMAKSLFDTVRLPGDDRAIGDVTWKELQGLARKHAEAYRLLALIDGYATPMNGDVRVREVLKEDTLREFVEIARLVNVH